MAQTDAAEPDDRCPYPRPFDWHFTDCPAFMPRLHLPTDTHGRELKAHWTCAHLAGRRHPSGAWYPGCALGSADDRARWAAVMKDGQLAAIRLARVELSQFIRPQLERVRQANAGQYDVLDSRRRNELRSAWAELVLAFDGFVDREPALFETAGIDPAQIRECFAEAMDEFSRRQGSREWRMAESIVGRYPWPIVAFFRPDLLRDEVLTETKQQ